MHFMHVYFKKDKKNENSVQPLKGYVLFKEMIPWLRVMFLIGSLGSEVGILFWSAEDNQIKRMMKQSKTHDTRHHRDMSRVSCMSVVRLLKTYSYMYWYNVWALYDLTKSFNGLYLHLQFST